MESKKIDVIDIQIDELALSLVGWQVEEAQGRIITEVKARGDFKQQLAVSATFRFLPEDWTDRFQYSNDDNGAPEIFITLNRRDNPAPFNCFSSVVSETIRKVKRGSIRVAEKSEPWSCQVPLVSKNLDLRLTSYDLHNVKHRLELPSQTLTPLEIVLVDETSVDAPRPNVATAQAFVSQGEYGRTLIMYAEGIFKFSGSNELLKVYKSRDRWVDRKATIKEAAPFEIQVPNISFEVLDSAGFLLEVKSCYLDGHISVDSQGKAPRRQPRWVVREEIDVCELPGDPHRVVMRVTDGE